MPRYIRLTRPSRPLRLAALLQVQRVVHSDEDMWTVRLKASIRRKRDLGTHRPLCEAMRGTGRIGVQQVWRAEQEDKPSENQSN